MSKKALKMGISLHRSPAGELGARGSFTRDSEGCLKEGSGNRASLNYGSSARAPLLGTLKDM
jgi:hypothetical protein